MTIEKDGLLIKSKSLRLRYRPEIQTKLLPIMKNEQHISRRSFST